MIRHLTRLNVLRSGCRTYLSSSYKCNQSWEGRLTSPTLARIGDKLDQFYADLETKHQQQKKVSAIDVDIFVNKVTGDNYVDEMADILHKLRMTEETTNQLDSTSHAFIRNLVEHDQIDVLLQVLRDPLNYGVFLDTYCANLVLDKLLEEKSFIAAAEVASLLMLQEDFGDDVTKSMCLLAAYKYLENPEPFVKVEAPVEEIKVAPTPVAKGKKAKKEELRVRVKFLRNPYFDDHFDIKESRHLVGKTLVRLSAELPKEMQASSKLLGLCLYEKYSECLQFIDTLTKEYTIHKKLLDKAVKSLEAHPQETNEDYKLLTERIQTVADKATVSTEEAFEKDVVAMIKSSIEKLEKKTVAEQEEVYKKWIVDREQKLQDELLRLKRAASIKEFEQVTKEMEMEEKKLWFFENEEQIELEIESKEVKYPKRWHGKKKNPRVIDEGYVPPEIKTVRNW